MKEKKEKVNYIDPDEFRDEVIKSQEENKCTERLAQLLLILHDHILTMPRFVNKPKQQKDEAKSFSIYRLLKKGIFSYKNNTTSRKCFNYFTTACVWNCTQCLMKMERYYDKYKDYCDDVYKDFRSKQPYALYQ